MTTQKSLKFEVKCLLFGFVHVIVFL